MQLKVIGNDKKVMSGLTEEDWQCGIEQEKGLGMWYKTRPGGANSSTWVRKDTQVYHVWAEQTG